MYEIFSGMITFMICNFQDTEKRFLQSLVLRSMQQDYMLISLS